MKDNTNKKIIMLYLKVLTGSIISVFILCYIMIYFFSNEEDNDGTMDFNLPNNYIQIIDRHISIDNNDNFFLAPTAIDYLNSIDAWLQILNSSGECVYNYNLPEGIPTKYDQSWLFELCTTNKKIDDYSLFFNILNYDESYCVIIGCNNLIDSTNNNSNFALYLQIFIIILLISISISVYVFSRKISTPISNVITTIQDIENNNYINKQYSNSLFDNVFITLDNLNYSLKKSDKVKEEWISNISHDLKTPLSSIKGYAEMLENKEYTFSAEEVQLYSGEILKSEKHLEELIEDLVLSQKLKEGKFPLHKETFSLNTLIQECIDRIDLNQYNNSKISFETTKELSITCDKKLLKRCFLNIIYNAFIHNPSDTEVVIDIKSDKHYISIVISDNGKGMTEQEMQLIFKRYYKGKSSKEINGTGLGLSIANESIIAHGGQINIESTVGEGSTFIIQLPC